MISPCRMATFMVICKGTKGPVFDQIQTQYVAIITFEESDKCIDLHCDLTKNGLVLDYYCDKRKENMSSGVIRLISTSTSDWVSVCILSHSSIMHLLKQSVMKHTNLPQY